MAHAGGVLQEARLGDLKNKQSTHTPGEERERERAFTLERERERERALPGTIIKIIERERERKSLSFIRNYP